MVTEATTAFLLLQIEQLHLRSFSSPFGNISSSSTEPQWHFEITVLILFPLDGRGRLTRDVIYDTRNTGDFVNDPICDMS